MQPVQIHEKYKPLYTSNRRYYLLTGGRASLKSTTVHDFVSRLTYQKDHGILLTRYTMKSAEKSIIPEFEDQIKRNGSFNDFVKSGTKYTNKTTGSFILFSGIKTSSGDQTANLKSLAGITTWVVDEGEDFTDEKVFDDIDDSIRSNKQQNRVIWIQNPSTKEHFIYKRWVEPYPAHIEVEGHKVTISKHPDVESIHTTYHIAESLGYLSKSFLQKTNRIKEEQPEYYYHKYIGGWLDMAEGAIYTNYEIGEFDESIPYVYGLDFGFDDPDCLTKVAVDHKRKIIYIQECIYNNGFGFDELGQAVQDICGYGDLVVADAAHKRLIRDLYEKYGINIVKCKKGAGSVARRIKTIQGYKLVITEDSPNVIKSVKNYVWHDKRANVPRHDWSHAPDSFGYAAMELITYL